MLYTSRVTTMALRHGNPFGITCSLWRESTLSRLSTNVNIVVSQRKAVKHVVEFPVDWNDAVFIRGFPCFSRAFNTIDREILSFGSQRKLWDNGYISKWSKDIWTWNRPAVDKMWRFTRIHTEPCIIFHLHEWCCRCLSLHNVSILAEDYKSNSKRGKGI